MKEINENCLSYWFPKLLTCDVHIPATEIIHLDERSIDALLKVFYKVMDEGISLSGMDIATVNSAILERIDKAAERVGGYPVFLKTGHISNKHYWKKSCFIESKSRLLNNIFNLVELSLLATLEGLPINVFVVRKLLAVDVSFHAFSGKMPITKERRYFIKGGRVICHHPYWPEDSIQYADCDDWKDKLRELNREDDNEVKELTNLSIRIAKKFEGFWSIDWLKSSNGNWYCIDMAKGEDSFHWSTCPNNSIDTEIQNIDRKDLKDDDTTGTKG